jgi:D-alanyl-lipoteichoic acid acyltransferase DltB (MBOAT superfamily)
VKYLFLAVLVNQLTYTGLFLDGHPHAWVDLPIAMASYYVYLYLNFSGYCDMAIGTAGLVGIRCAENFDNPFAARNVKEFWNRWHITLSTYMRDVVFSPLSTWLVRRVGATRANHATAACIMVVFLIVGVWHGVGWNFLLFGLAHGLAVVANHYYTLFLKKRLGRERFLAYGKNPLVRWIAVGSTFAYISASLFLFANDITSMRSIFALLR